jgi:hypothetical protein
VGAEPGVDGETRPGRAISGDVSQGPYGADPGDSEPLPGLAAKPPRAGGPELRRTWLRWTVAAATAILTGGVLAGMFVAARYEARLGQVQREMSALREGFRREEFNQSVVDLLRDPATLVVVLRGAGPALGAHGRVVWRDGAGGHVFLSKLPPAPKRMAYELWTIRGRRPRPAGRFQPDAEGRATARVPPVGGPVEAFMVTLEPVGGVPAPTGPVVLASR